MFHPSEDGGWRMTCGRAHCHDGASNHSAIPASFSIGWPLWKVARLHCKMLINHLTLKKFRTKNSFHVKEHYNHLHMQSWLKYIFWSRWCGCLPLAGLCPHWHICTNFTILHIKHDKHVLTYINLTVQLRILVGGNSVNISVPIMYTPFARVFPFPCTVLR
jgi:hypothetical protein